MYIQVNDVSKKIKGVTVLNHRKRYRYDSKRSQRFGKNDDLTYHLWSR